MEGDMLGGRHKCLFDEGYWFEEAVTSWQLIGIVIFVGLPIKGVDITVDLVEIKTRSSVDGL